MENAAIDLIADAQCKAKLHIARSARSLGWGDLQEQLEDSARQHRNYESAVKALADKKIPAEKIPAVASPTNNFHQVRLGAALAGIESLAFLSKVSSLKGEKFDVAAADALASALSVSAILTDMMYAYTKSVRELPNYAAIDGVKNGADIVRGGFKLAAGLLAACAGGFTAWYDWQKSGKESNPFLKAIYRARSMHGWASTGAGLLAAYSYTSPLFQHLAAKNGRSAVSKSLLTIAAARAKQLSDRVLLLRTVAWLGWAGVAITIVDLSYAGYRWYVDYTAIARWLNRCTFRLVKTNKNFPTATVEIRELRLALHPTQETQ